jgi:hypothetical protein
LASGSIFRITEPTVTLAGADGSDIPGPLVYILEKMMVQRPIVREIPIALWQSFRCAGIEHQLFELIKLLLIFDICLVA